MSVVVAGHVCLDVIPELAADGLRFEPGRLLEIGAATFACGGAVANVGQALLRLGVPVVQVGRVGDDPFGDVVRARLGAVDPGAAAGLRVAPGESTSYTLVLAPSGGEHMFLHHPGCNDAFGADDVDLRVVERARVFYFGYPPLMKRVHEDGGVGLATLLGEIRSMGVTTVLDMAMPDPDGPSGRVDWRAFLERALPHVDVFLPSVGEIALMLGRSRPAGAAAGDLRELASTLLGMGARVVGLKLGADGLYLRTARQGGAAGALGRALGGGPGLASAWSERELWSPVFEAAVAGTTGAGDATVAGFIHAMLRGAEPEAALEWACGVGGASVEAVDSVSGIPSADDLRRRLAAGWPRAAHTAPAGWRAVGHGVYASPEDRARAGAARG